MPAIAARRRQGDWNIHFGLLNWTALLHWWGDHLAGTRGLGEACTAGQLLALQGYALISPMVISSVTIPSRICRSTRKVLMLDELQCRGWTSFSHLFSSEILEELMACSLLSTGHVADVALWLHLLMEIFTAAAGHKKLQAWCMSAAGK